MNFIEDYSSMFEKIAEQDGTLDNYSMFMKQEQKTPQSNLDIDEINGKNMNKETYEDPIVSIDFKPFKAKTNASPVQKPTLSDEPTVTINVDDDEEIDIEDLSEDDREAYEKMMKSDPEKEWETSSKKAMNTFQTNFSKMTGKQKVATAVETKTSVETKDSFPKQKTPEFMEVKKIQPMTSVNKNPFMKEDTIETATISNENIKNNDYDPCDDEAFQRKSDEAVKKCRKYIDEMPSMAKYDENYKNKCAYTLHKYMDLPKSKFESLCKYMESVN